MNPSTSLKAPRTTGSRWFSINLAENEAAIWIVEDVTVYAQRVLGDWMLARDDSEIFPVENTAQKIPWIPLHVEWKRWALEHEAKEIRFWPTLPDRPLVVKTRIPVIVPPCTSIELFISLPVWLEVSVNQADARYTLDKIALTTLSNTWFGSYFEGQLCYALKSRARRSLADLSDNPLRAVCLFRIHNRSEESLPVEKIRIDPVHLSLFQSKGRLWTNSVTVTFRGEETHSELKYETSAPESLEKSELIREAEQPVERGSIIDRIFFRSHNQD